MFKWDIYFFNIIIIYLFYIICAYCFLSFQGAPLRRICLCLLTQFHHVVMHIKCSLVKSKQSQLCQSALI